MAASHRPIIDRVVRRATHRLPRSERERIHKLCDDATREQTNPGVAGRMASAIATRESEAWLEQSRRREAERADNIAAVAEETDRETASFVEEIKAGVAPYAIRKAPNGLLPKEKCVHGHYLAEWYCEVCRDGHENEPEYRRNEYAQEIRKAIRPALENLPGDEGQKDYKDLAQEAAIEVWKAAKHYGAKMNAKIAYKVARNVRGKFLADRIERMSPAAYDCQGSPILDENGESKRVHLVSLNRHLQDEDGNETAAKDVEVALADSSLSPETLAQAQEEQEHICAVAQSFHGLMREVAEAMLVAPDFNLDVPAFCRARGRAQRTVYRAYQAVRQAFRAALQKTDDADEKT